MAVATHNRITFSVLDPREGDRRLSFDKGKKDEVEDARATFENHVKQLGYAAFAMDPQTGNKGVQIRDFDPNVEEMLLVPASQGG